MIPEVQQSSTCNEPPDRMATIAASAVEPRSMGETVVVVVDQGVGIYRVGVDRIAPLLRLGCGASPVVGGILGTSSPQHHAGPGSLLEACRTRSQELLFRAVPQTPSEIHGAHAFAHGYPSLRAELATEGTTHEELSLLASRALGVAIRDIRRLIGTARTLAPGLPLHVVGPMFDLPQLVDGLRGLARAIVVGSGPRATENEDSPSVAMMCDVRRQPWEATQPSIARLERQAEMQVAPDDFASLIAPMPPGEFLRSFYDRRPVVLEGAPSTVSGLLRGDRFIELVREVHRRWPYAPARSVGCTRLEAFEDGRCATPNAPDLPYPDHWDENLTWTQAHHAPEARERWTRTIRVTAAHHVDDQLESALWQLHETFQSHCTVNLYYSPPTGTPGLSHHFDSTHIFVLQLEGSKHWEVGAGPVTRPQERQAQLGRLQTSQGRLEPRVHLRRGDVLYLPPHTLHRAIATNEPSLHATFAVFPHHREGFIGWLANEIATQESVPRSTCHVAGAISPRVELDPGRLAHVLDTIRDELGRPDLIERFIGSSLAEARKKTELGVMG